MSRWRKAVLGGACAALGACGTAHDAPPPSSQHGRLPPGVAARVGVDEVRVDTVARIARAQGVPLAVARDRALSDALFAASARSALRNSDLPATLERAALARALLESLKQDALSGGPATDAEVAELTALRWRELDRPESARTTHAVALVHNPADDPKARAVAERIFEAVKGITDQAEFLRIARGIPHENIEIRAERLPAVTADGRVFDPDKPSADSEQSFDLTFAKAAMQLGAGQISEPIKTQFGYHVILCEARLPEQRVPLEQRRQLFHDEVVKRRAERAKQELLARLGAATPFQMARAADEMMSLVRVEE